MSVIQQTSENNLQLAKRRAEREAADFKQKALKCAFFHAFRFERVADTTDSLERELERLRSRLDRPSSGMLLGSPANSPRKGKGA